MHFVKSTQKFEDRLGNVLNLIQIFQLCNKSLARRAPCK